MVSQAITLFTGYESGSAFISAGARCQFHNVQSSQDGLLVVVANVLPNTRFVGPFAITQVADESVHLNATQHERST